MMSMTNITRDSKARPPAVWEVHGVLVIARKGMLIGGMAVL